MPERKTLRRARRDRQEGKATSTQAGEFVRETMEHILEGKHGARSTKQAIAIGLSKARRAGVKLPPPEKGTVPEATRRNAKQDLQHASSGDTKTNPKRSKATTKALRREGHAAASKAALSRQAKVQARSRTAEERSAIGRKAARTRAAHQHSAQRRTRTARSHRGDS